ncbi:MAG: 2,3-bisphosphoglycerate-independent phosphoglycerate mutase [Clostridia bacterium]|nr:2,3-bisphosphoglycerate-independent phosphoglycerate mutase [Clostridia bacterium]
MLTLCILDGFGINHNTKGNAVKLQGTPFLSKLQKEFPTTSLSASGLDVGLPEGQMGNSEVGHLNLGAGRVVFQDLPKINNEISSGKFFSNPAFLKTINHVKKNNSALHLMGLVSPGGIHSHINHLKALVDLAAKEGVKNVFIHAITDGRDTLRDSGIAYLAELDNHIKGKAKIATIAGRVYTMDRENRWDRIKLSYDMLVYGKADHHYSSAEDCMKDSYAHGIYDEFVEPSIIVENALIRDGDGVIFFNYRTDRAREITNALSQKNFDKFDHEHFKNLAYCCMTEYSADFKDVLIAYPPEVISDNLSAIISKNGMKQFHTSETTKYAHVTFFFNGGIEKAYPGEDRKLIDSYNVKDYSEVPNMRAPEITDAVVDAINSKKYDFILVNISNPDMLGHTGNLQQAIKSIETTDNCIKRMAEATLACGGEMIITADHGNCEEMIDKNGNILTQHTTNPVPFVLVSERYKNVKLKTGKLANVAPTALKLLGLPANKNMEQPLF